MSKILTELSVATGVKAKRGQDRQELILAIMAGVTSLSDAAWEDLSQETQDWFNAAADAKNAKKKTLPDFPDAEEEQEEEAPKTSRRGSTEKAEAKGPAGTKEIEADDVEKGMSLRVITKRGKDISGKVTGVDGSGFTLKYGSGDEDDFDFSRVEKLMALDLGGDAKEEEAGDPIKVGAMVTLTTKRDKVVTGKIVELDDEVIVLDVDGKDEEFSRDRVASIKAAGVKAEAPKSSRRGASDEKADDKEEKLEGKAPRASNASGVSIGQRIKELICEDMGATQPDIAKALKKEGIDFKDNTLNLNYVDAHKFITILKAAKKLK